MSDRPFRHVRYGTDARRGLGGILGNALHKRRANSLVLVIKCEHYIKAQLSCDHGSFNEIDLTKVEGSNAVDRTELAAYQALRRGYSGRFIFRRHVLKRWFAARLVCASSPLSNLNTTSLLS